MSNANKVSLLLVGFYFNCDPEHLTYDSPLTRRLYFLIKA
jgi:hypothetical protein